MVHVILSYPPCLLPIPPLPLPLPVTPPLETLGLASIVVC